MYNLEFQFGNSLEGICETALFPFTEWFWCVNQLYLHSPFNIVGSHILIRIKLSINVINFEDDLKWKMKFVIMVISEEGGKWREFWRIWKKGFNLYFIAKYKDTYISIKLGNKYIYTNILNSSSFCVCHILQ